MKRCSSPLTEENFLREGERMSDPGQIDLASAYKKYTADVKKEIIKAENRVSRKMIAEIRKGSPVSEPYQNKTARGTATAARTKERSGRYKNNWAIKTKTDKGGARIMKIAYNKTDGPLAHLLDLGHRNRDGSRFESNKYHGYIRNAQKQARTELAEDIKNILK